MRKKSKSNQAIWVQMNLPPQAPQTQREEDKETRKAGNRPPLVSFSLSPPPLVSLSSSLCVCGGMDKKSGRKIEQEARPSGLFSRRVLFSLFFVSNFETDLWDQVLPLDQSQRLVF